MTKWCGSNTASVCVCTYSWCVDAQFFGQDQKGSPQYVDVDLWRRKAETSLKMKTTRHGQKEKLSAADSYDDFHAANMG